MKFEKDKISTFYKRLISLYPQDFRERFGESMEQTFNDVCNEQKLKGNLSLGFVFSMFAETSVSIIRENLSALKGANQMNYWLKNIGIAVLFGLLLISPFAFMEYWNNPVIQSVEVPFPFMLFFGLWLTPVIFFLGATPIVRIVWAGESVLAHPISLVLRIIFLAFLAILWLNLLRDQMPCFLGGVPGCD